MASKKRLHRQSVDRIRRDIKATYDNKYYNIFMNSLKFEGDITYEERNWLMKQMWTDGTICITKDDYVDVLHYTPYLVTSYNYLEYPETIRLVNTHQAPFINVNRNYITNKDAVLLWILPSQQPIRRVVDYYISRLVQVDMVINTNLNVHKLPFFVGVSEQDIDKANDIIDRILNDELVIFRDLDDLNLVKSYAAGAPYIIDKLYQYRKGLESELQTYLGVDNAGADNSKDRFLVDEVNANNIETNTNMKGFIDNLTAGFEKVSELFGITITVRSNIEQSCSIHEQESSIEEDTNDEL